MCCSREGCEGVEGCEGGSHINVLRLVTLGVLYVLQLHTLNTAMESEPENWDKNGISAVLLGVKGLLVEDLEMAKGGATVLSEKARDELAANNHDLQVGGGGSGGGGGGGSSSLGRVRPVVSVVRRGSIRIWRKNIASFPYGIWDGVGAGGLRRMDWERCGTEVGCGTIVLMVVVAVVVVVLGVGTERPSLVYPHPPEHPPRYHPGLASSWTSAAGPTPPASPSSESASGRGSGSGWSSLSSRTPQSSSSHARRASKHPQSAGARLRSSVLLYDPLPLPSQTLGNRSRKAPGLSGEAT